MQNKYEKVKQVTNTYQSKYTQNKQSTTQIAKSTTTTKKIESIKPSLFNYSNNENSMGGQGLSSESIDEKIGKLQNLLKSAKNN